MTRYSVAPWPWVTCAAGTRSWLGTRGCIPKANSRRFTTLSPSGSAESPLMDGFVSSASVKYCCCHCIDGAVYRPGVESDIDLAPGQQSCHPKPRHTTHRGEIAGKDCFPVGLECHRIDLAGIATQNTFEGRVNQSNGSGSRSVKTARNAQVKRTPFYW